MQCIAIQHVAFENLGSFEPVLRGLSCDIRYIQAGVQTVSLADWENADLAVVLGGPISVYENHLYPFIDQEIELIKARIKTAKPLLGICLGAQMIAAALGAKVYPGKQKEIGWGFINLTNDGRTSCLSVLEMGVPVLHWHGDTFDLPKGARRLASTEVTPNQAFAYGENVLALQFHPEADGSQIEKWLIGHSCELSQSKIDPCTIRHDSRRYQEQASAAAEQILHAWLKDLGLEP